MITLRVHVSLDLGRLTPKYIGLINEILPSYPTLSACTVARFGHGSAADLPFLLSRGGVVPRQLRRHNQTTHASGMTISDVR
jgi:hypothetical protein